MKTLTSLRRAGYRGTASAIKRAKVRVQRHAWKVALSQNREPVPTARWLAHWGV
jgi:hypothetical protein